MAESLKFANEEFEKFLKSDKNINDGIEKKYKFYYFLCGFQSGTKLSVDDLKTFTSNVLKRFKENVRKQ